MRRGVRDAVVGVAERLDEEAAAVLVDDEAVRDRRRVEDGDDGDRVEVELKPLLDAGEYYWITILDQKNNGQAADQTTVANWYASYPHDGIPVLADSEELVFDYIGGAGWPSMFMVKDNMVVYHDGASSYIDALEALVDYINNK